MKIQTSNITFALLAASAASIAFVPEPDAPDFTIPNEFVAGTTAKASEVNDNFTAMSVSMSDYATEVNTAIADQEAVSESLSTSLDALEAEVVGLSRPGNLILVAGNGGDFTSVAEALASITDSSDSNRYCVLVAPGVYSESDVCAVPAFVELRGSGRTATVVTSTRSGAVQNSSSATVSITAESRVSRMTIRNEGSSSTFSIGIYGGDLSRDTVLEDLDIRVDGSGGVGHFAVYVSESDMTIESCKLFAGGANAGAAINAAFSCVDNAGAFSQPLLRNSELEGDGTVSGFGCFYSKTAATIEGCLVQGDFRSISASISGTSTVLNSKIQALGLNPVYEQTGSSAILSGSCFFVGGGPIGLASQFKYAHCIKPNFDVVVNGFGSDI
ncbi:MAG: hypothetical protein ACI835_003298 [Planctomycetota bacterium]|jgi:hypothetical protein